MIGAVWNPWHGCTKYSEGCRNCYVYRTDSAHGRDSNIITKTSSFDLAIKRKRDGSYKLLPGDDNIIYTCFTSDFLHPAADCWRPQIWEMIQARSDLNFLFITKRINRFGDCIPEDWGNGYDNVIIGCTVENQEEADRRLPIFISSPIKNRIIICEPILSLINVETFLSEKISQLIVGGESGIEARVCDFKWVKSLRDQCEKKNVAFRFKQTGANFLMNDRIYIIQRKFQHSQAKKANIDFTPKYILGG